MGGIKSAWKEVKPIKFVLILASVFIVDFIIMEILIYFDCLDWWWKSTVVNAKDIYYAITGSLSLNGQEFITVLLIEFIGLTSAVFVFAILWDAVPNIVIKLLGAKGKGQEQENANPCKCD